MYRNRMNTCICICCTFCNNKYMDTQLVCAYTLGINGSICTQPLPLIYSLETTRYTWPCCPILHIWRYYFYICIHIFIFVYNTLYDVHVPEHWASCVRLNIQYTMDNSGQSLLAFMWNACDFMFSSYFISVQILLLSIGVFLSCNLLIFTWQCRL